MTQYRNLNLILIDFDLFIAETNIQRFRPLTKQSLALPELQDMLSPSSLCL